MGTVIKIKAVFFVIWTVISVFSQCGWENFKTQLREEFLFYLHILPLNEYIERPQFNEKVAM